MTVSVVKKQFVRPNYSRAPTKMVAFKSTKQSTSKSMVRQNDIRGPEQKDITVSVNALALPATAVFSAPVLFGSAAQGVGTFQRVGRRLNMKSVMMRYGSNNGNPFRILIVYDKQTNGALPANTDILVNDNFHATLNLTNADRFVTIFDKMVIPETSGGIIDTLYRKVELETMFSGTGAAITDIAGGSLYYLFAPVTAAAAISISFTTRVRFTDI